MTSLIGASPAALPVELTSFVGRRRELADLRRLLPTTRLLTLTGTGGVGKTRLALQAGRDVARQFPDGIRLVELAPVADPQLVTQAAFAAFGLQDRSSSASLATLASFLAAKQALLILDNCEHVLPSAAELAGTLLRACPDVRIIATSRRALGVTGEVVVAVPPMTSADDGSAEGDAWARSDAVALFAERASAVQPGFELGPANGPLVLGLCARLGDLPLAVELAAARLNALGLEGLDRGLRTRLDALGTGDWSAALRQRTLEGAIDWSYRLLTAEEQRLWMLLSVFAGGFDIRGVVSVCAGEGEDEAALRLLLGKLVDQSVVERGTDRDAERFRLLEPLRQFGRDRLREAGREQDARTRHLDWIASIAADVAAGDARQVELFDRLRVERANLWSALDLATEDPSRTSAGIEIASHLWIYWSAQGPINDIRRVLAQLLAQAPPGSRSRALALTTSGTLAIQQNDNVPAGPALAEAIDIGRRLRDAEVVANALASQSALAWAEGRPADAAIIADEGVALSRIMGLPAMTLRNLSNRGYALLGQGLLGEAIEDAREGIALSERQGEVWERGILHQLLAAAALLSGHAEDAAEYARSALALEGSLDDRTGQAHTVSLLASAEAACGAASTAATLQGASEALLRSVPTSLMEPFRPQHAASVELAVAALGTDRYARAFDTGLAMDPSAIVEFAVRGRLPERAPSKPPPARGPSHAPLSTREMEVARLVADGATNAQVAARLFISERTVESHMASVMNKLAVDSRVRVARWVATVEPRSEPSR